MTIIRERTLGITKNSIKKNLNKAKKMTRSSFEINKVLSDKEKSEINNIIGILLDTGLSMETRLMRVGRSPASSGVVRVFKKNIVKRAKNYAKKQILNKTKIKTLSGILNLRLHDMGFTSFLKDNVESCVKNAVKAEEKVLTLTKIQKVLPRGKDIVVKAKVAAVNKKVSMPTQKPALQKIDELQKPQKKTSENTSEKTERPTQSEMLNPFKGIKFTEMVTKVVKVSQVKLLEESRKNQDKRQNIGKTMPEPLKK